MPNFKHNQNSYMLFLLILLCTTLAKAQVSSLSFDLPASSTRLNLDNVSRLYFEGNCDTVGEQIVLKIENQSPMNAACMSVSGAKKWSFANVSIAALADGPIKFTVSRASNPATLIERTLIKDTLLPVVLVTEPKNGDAIVSTNFKTFVVKGICTEVGQPIRVQLKRAVPDAAVLPIESTVNCPIERTWQLTFDLTALGTNTDVQLIAVHADSNGNEGIASSSYYMDVQEIETTFTSLPAFINTINAAAIAIRGTCNKQNSYITLNVSVAGTPYSQSFTTNCISSKWNFNQLSFAGPQVPDGTITLTLRLANPLTGQMSTTTQTVIKDTVPPLLAITKPATGYRMTVGTGPTFRLEGTCSENGRNIAVTGSKTETIPCTAGAFSRDVNLSALADGDMQFSVRATDAAGNDRVQSFSFNKDVLPARLTVNPVAFINASNATTLRFTGTCSEGGAYAQPVRVTGAITATAICQPDSTWSLNFSTYVVADGTLTFNFDHADAAGNAAPRIVLNVTKDTLPPTLDITVPTLPTPPSKFMINLANVDTVVFGGTCNDATATITASGAMTGSSPCTGGRWSIPASAMRATADGDVTVSFTITDPGMNTRRQDAIVFKDTRAPTLTIVGSPYLVNPSSPTNVIINGTCSENGSFAQPVFISGIDPTPLQAVCQPTVNTWTLSVAKTKFVEGTTSFTVNHSDLAGNRTTQTGSVIRDSNPPTLTLVTGTGTNFVNASNATNFELRGACSENGRSINIAGAASGVGTCSSGIWSVRMNFSGIPDGNLALTANHADAGGNIVSQSLTLIKDVVVPTLTIANPTEGQDINSTSTYTFAGACSENGRVVTLTGSFAATTNCSSGAWSSTQNVSTMPDGTVTAEMSDPSGNKVTVTRNFVNPSGGLAPVFAKNMMLAGTSHTCVVVGGALQCWGINNFGQIGDGTKITRTIPKTILASGVQAVSAGDTHACAVVSGALRCWGDNRDGQLGDGTTSESLLPKTIIANDVQAVAAKIGYTCAIVRGALQCWGSPNKLGALGDGTGNGSLVPKTIISSGVQAVAAGYYHTCAVVSGALQCWGSNYSGQLGDGARDTKVLSPKTIISSGVQTVSAGGHHTCAIVNSALWCWGSNKKGSLGDGTTTDSLIPKLIIPSGVQAISTGWGHTCAIVNGALRCWGENFAGQVGDGTRTDSLVPKTIISNGVQAIHAGTMHTCAIANRSLMCWGSNSLGQIGIADLIATVPTIKSGISNVADVGVGGLHTCVVHTDGRVSCWGENFDGQLGNATGPNGTITPVFVTGIANAIRIATGSTDFNCAIHSNRTVSCWGEVYGNQPKLIAGINDAVSISAGQNKFCVVTGGNQIQCVANGGLSAPAPSLSNIKSVHLGGTSQEFAITNAGTVLHLDGNLQSNTTGISKASAGFSSVVSLSQSGEIRYGTRIDFATVQSSITNATEVIAGTTIYCAILADKTVRCWGSSNLTLGDGETFNSASPVTALGINSAEKIAAARTYSDPCVVLTDKRVSCWGYAYDRVVPTKVMDGF